MILIILFFLLVLYIAYDVNYCLRTLATFCLMPIYRKRTIYDTTNSYGICLTNDFGVTFDHMNNSRYHREVDFGRVLFYYVTGINRKLKKVKGHFLLGASFIRFRRKISLFSLYRIESQMVYYDEKALYQIHKFITLSDNFVRAVIVSQEVIVGIKVPDLLKELPGGAIAMDCPEEVKVWKDAIEVLSAKFRRKENLEKIFF